MLAFLITVGAACGLIAAGIGINLYLYAHGALGGTRSSSRLGSMFADQQVLPEGANIHVGISTTSEMSIYTRRLAVIVLGVLLSFALLASLFLTVVH